MYKDSLIEEIHKKREEILKEFNYDMRAIFEHTKKRQEKEKKKGRKIVTLAKKKEMVDRPN